MGWPWVAACAAREQITHLDIIDAVPFFAIAITTGHSRARATEIATPERYEDGGTWREDPGPAGVRVEVSSWDAGASVLGGPPFLRRYR
jgi:hypothetical protein